MKKLNISFFGAPDFAARVLEKIMTDLSDKVTVNSVFTQPDRPAGRKQILTPTPVKLLAQKHNIPVFTDLSPVSNLQSLNNSDLVLLYAYGSLLPTNILKIPRWGFWNIHPSLLPQYRGTSPIVYSLLMGDKKTGVSLIEMDERMDHGPIIDQKEYVIQPTDMQETLKKRLSDIGYELFKKNVQLLLDGALQKKEQDNKYRTFTRLLTKQDGYIPFPIVQKILKGDPIRKDDIPPIITGYYNKYHLPISNLQPPITYYNFYRALFPWPGLWTKIPADGTEKRLRITDMSLTTNHQPLITKVQLEGKKEVNTETFKKAYRSFLNL